MPARTGRPTRGPAPAAPSRPGRRGCGRAGRPRRRGASAAASSAAYRASRAAASGPPAVADLDARRPDRVEAERRRACARGRRGDVRRAVLQPVVDDHRAGAQPGSRRLERHSGGEGERVGAAAARTSTQGTGLAGRPAPRARPAHLGDRGMRPGHRLAPPASGRGRGRTQAPRVARSRPACGRCLGDVQTRLKPSMPTSSTTARTNAAPSRYWRSLASRPSSRRSTRSSGPAPLAALLELRPDLRDRRHHRGADPVHHDVRVALEQGHDGR